MSWAETIMINGDLSTPLNTLIDTKTTDIKNNTTKGLKRVNKISVNKSNIHERNKTGLLYSVSNSKGGVIVVSGSAWDSYNANINIQDLIWAYGDILDYPIITIDNSILNNEELSSYCTVTYNKVHYYTFPFGSSISIQYKTGSDGQSYYINMALHGHVCFNS